MDKKRHKSSLEPFYGPIKDRSIIPKISKPCVASVTDIASYAPGCVIMIQIDIPFTLNRYSPITDFTIKFLTYFRSRMLCLILPSYFSWYWLLACTAFFTFATPNTRAVAFKCFYRQKPFTSLTNTRFRFLSHIQPPAILVVRGCTISQEAVIPVMDAFFVVFLWQFRNNSH